jgi:hypothetical protein
MNADAAYRQRFGVQSPDELRFLPTEGAAEETDPQVLALAMLEAAEQAGSPEEARAAVARIAALAGPKPAGGAGTKPFRG